MGEPDWDAIGQFTWSVISGAILLRLAWPFVLDHAGSAWNEHGVPDKRSLSDPRVTWIHGSVEYAGHPTPFAAVVATVQPTGYAWTVDTVTSKVDGRFEIPITSGSFDGPRKVSIEAQLGDLRGGITLTASPGQRVSSGPLEVGPGFIISGTVQNGAHAAVRFGSNYADVQADGSFKLVVYQAGADRLALVDGEELPLERVAPRIVVDHPFGSHTDIVLAVNEPAVEHFALGSGIHDAGTVRARFVARSGNPPARIKCVTPHGRVDIGDGHAVVDIPLLRYADHLWVSCEGVEIHDVHPARELVVPVLSETHERSDFGVEVRAEPSGARVVDVAPETQSAGLQRDDLITAINGVPVQHLSVRVVREFGFRELPGPPAVLSITRNNQQLTVALRLP